MRETGEPPGARSARAARTAPGGAGGKDEAPGAARTIPGERQEGDGRRESGEAGGARAEPVAYAPAARRARRAGRTASRTASAPAATGPAPARPARPDSPARPAQSERPERAERPGHPDQPVPPPRLDPSRRPPGLESATAGEVLGGFLHACAAELLRGLRPAGADAAGGGAGAGTAGGAEAAADSPEAVRRLRRAARRLSGALYTYRPLLDPDWADGLRGELHWLSGTVAREYVCAARLDHLLGALHRLTGEGASSAAGSAGALPMGAARAGALLERQLRLARTRAHSAALHALVSVRFHALADAVAVLASEAPLAPGTADAPAAHALVPLADHARRRLVEAVAQLPLTRAASPYNTDASARSLGPEPRQDGAWHHVRQLLRLHRYAEEVLARGAAPDAPADAYDGGARPWPAAASGALDRHRDAAESAAAAATAARTPRIAPATAYALGVLHADQRHEVEASRFTFVQLWQRAAAGVRPA